MHIVSRADGYPTFFPQGCPPEDASNKEIVVYRLTYTATPTADDFLSPFELNDSRCSKILAEGNYAPMAVSVFSREAEARSTWSKIPAIRKKYHYCAKGRTPTDSGVHTTPNAKGHISWWIKEEATPEVSFSNSTQLDGGPAL